MTRSPGLFTGVFAAAALVVLGACTTPSPDSSSRQDYPADPGLLRVAVSPDSRPIIYKQNGKYLGLDAELARMLAKELGREVVFVELPFDELIGALDRNEADVILSNLSVTAARQMRVSFTQPYMPSGQMALLRRTDLRTNFKNPTDVVMTDRVVGVEKATTGQYFVESLFENAKLRQFTDPEDAAKALIDGKIDVFIHDAPVVWRLAGDFETEGLVPLNTLLNREFIAGAVALGNAELLEQINAVLNKWLDDGTLPAVVRRWVPFLG